MRLLNTVLNGDIVLIWTTFEYCKNNRVRSVNITIRKQLLKQVDSHLHVGIPLCNTKKADKDFCNERTTCHKKLVNMILSIGSSTGGINPISGGKLYWANLF